MLLSYWRLIELKQHNEYNDKICGYTIYQLQNIMEKELGSDFETDIEAEMKANAMSDELFEKVMFKMPEIFEDD